jgi:16S rRNA U1498 N3-methylase RsmE
MSQKRHLKNLKRKKSKPQLSKFEQKQEKIRAEIINAAMSPIRTNLLNSLNKNTQASQQSSGSHHSAVKDPTGL